jgi:hypothetical protein
MVVAKSTISDQVKINVRNVHKCPFCHNSFQISIEREKYLSLIEEGRFPYPHLHLHGSPLHAMISYIDSDFRVRSIECISSIEVFRDSVTFTQIAKKWANPF